jgi:chromosome segregation ATPase
LTLLIKCAELQEQLELVDSSQRRKTIAADLQREAIRLEGKRDELAENITQAVAFKKRSLDVIDELEEVEQTTTFLSKVRELFEEDSHDLTKGKHYSNLLNALQELCNSLDTKLQASWEEYKRIHDTTVDENKLMLHEGKKADLVEKIERLNVAAGQERLQPPLTEEDFTRLEKAFRELKDAYGRLPKDSDNPKVQAFLDAATDDGASLVLLTDEVRKYLKEVGIEELFTVYR